MDMHVTDEYVSIYAWLITHFVREERGSLFITNDEWKKFHHISFSELDLRSLKQKEAWNAINKNWIEIYFKRKKKNWLKLTFILRMLMC